MPWVCYMVDAILANEVFFHLLMHMESTYGEYRQIHCHQESTDNRSSFICCHLPYLISRCKISFYKLFFIRLLTIMRLPHTFGYLHVGEDSLER